MDKNIAQIIIKVISIVYLIIGILSLLLTLLVVYGLLSKNNFLTNMFQKEGLIVIFILLLIFSVVYTLIGLGLWKHKKWARISAIFISILGLLNFPFGTIINLIALYLLILNKDIKSLFS